MSDLTNRPDSFREAVCVEAQRIFDSCSDKDCLEDLPVTLDSGYEIGEDVTIIKCRCASVSDVCISCEPVPFNKGFYSVDITYTFDLTLDTYDRACGIPVTVPGTASFSKKCILFGSEGNTKTFYSNGVSQGTTNSGCCETVNLPRVAVQVADPMILDSRLISKCCDCNGHSNNNGNGNNGFISPVQRIPVVSLGLFTIVQISRPVALLMPVYDYCIPQKECTTNTDSPCELFEKIKFPTDEFFPPALEADCDGAGCRVSL